MASVRTPTLVVAAPTFPATVDAARRLAAGIPGAQLHLFGGRLNEHLDGTESEPSQALLTLTSFLQSLPVREPEVAVHSAPGAGTLSAREIEVLRLIVAGRSNAQIGEALVISPNTVARHVSNIFDKVGLTNRAEATAYAMRNGLA